DRVMGVGVRRRFFDGATRRAIEVRDRECYSFFCEAPAQHCEVDHVQPWSAGGLTTQQNGRLACGYHNRWRNHRRGPP
ncbi:MAG: HNH endonuclease signature motif containing protein, partial [Acidimicrobiales bacterium]